VAPRRAAQNDGVDRVVPALGHPPLEHSTNLQLPSGVSPDCPVGMHFLIRMKRGAGGKGVLTIVKRHYTVGGDRGLSASTEYLTFKGDVSSFDLNSMTSST
jgi:hypothetical protein